MASLLCIPPHISRVPPPVAAECVILHRDVDSQKKGFTTGTCSWSACCRHGRGVAIFSCRRLGGCTG
ncbi:hypothetical protein EON67_08215 [archaeon]|nr:MAG: hypothetical protein EON67_08215 [archaeon]